MENSMKFPQKVKNGTVRGSSSPTLGTYPRKVKSGSGREVCTSKYIVTSFTISIMRKQPKCPLTDKENVAYMHNRLVFSFKKEGNPPYCTTWMSLEDITLSQTVMGDKYYMSHFYMKLLQ
jgi:hypothetical protein